MWSWKIFAGLLYFWLVLALMCGVVTKMYFNGNQTNIITVLMTPQTPAYTNPVGGITMVFSVAPAFLSSLWSALWLDFPIFYGAWAIFRFMFLCIFIGIIVAMVTSSIKPY